MGVLFLAACGKDNKDNQTQPTVTPLQANFQSLNANVIGPKCLSCHGETAPIKDKHGNEIRLGSYDHLLKYISPGNPDASKLFKDIKTGDMPRPKGNPLPASTVELFQTWIQNGAKQN
jgi:hypothetical protein